MRGASSAQMTEKCSPSDEVDVAEEANAISGSKCPAAAWSMAKGSIAPSVG